MLADPRADTAKATGVAPAIGRWADAPRLRKVTIDAATRRTWAEALAGVGLGVCAIGLRAALNPVIGASTPFILYFPAVTAACVGFGPTAGALCLAVCCLGGVVLFMPGLGHMAHPPRYRFAFLIFIAAGAALVWLTARQRASLRALEAAHRQERLLIAELQHRVKNTLAIVQSLATQTLKFAASPSDIEVLFTERLRALAKAHDALSETSWEGVSLRGLLGRTLEPFVIDQADRITLLGEDVLAPPDQIVGLALCFHELATNATKYGALSRTEGRVEIAWRTREAASGRRLELTWTERGGPPVAPPARRGFGSRVLTGGLSARTRPEVSLDYRREGLAWRATFDLAPI
jgi:two-component sensor histidine kinase